MPYLICVITFSFTQKSRQFLHLCRNCWLYRTKRTSPHQTLSIPQSLRDLLRFARQMQTAKAVIFLLASGRILRGAVFYTIGSSKNFLWYKKNFCMNAEVISFIKRFRQRRGRTSFPNNYYNQFSIKSQGNVIQAVTTTFYFF